MVVHSHACVACRPVSSRCAVAPSCYPCSMPASCERLQIGGALSILRAISVRYHLATQSPRHYHKLCHHAALQPKHIARVINLRPATVLQYAPLLAPVPQVQRSAQSGHNPTHVSGGGQAQERGTVQLRSGMYGALVTNRQATVCMGLWGRVVWRLCHTRQPGQQRPGRCLST